MPGLLELRSSHLNSEYSTHRATPLALGHCGIRAFALSLFLGHSGLAMVIFLAFFPTFSSSPDFNYISLKVIPSFLAFLQALFFVFIYSCVASSLFFISEKCFLKFVVISQVLWLQPQIL